MIQGKKKAKKKKAAPRRTGIPVCAHCGGDMLVYHTRKLSYPSHMVDHDQTLRTRYLKCDTCGHTGKQVQQQITSRQTRTRL